MYTRTFSFLSTYKIVINRPWKIFVVSKNGVANTYHNYITCKELKIVNIHANPTVFSFIASSPNTQVQPSTGITIIAPLSNALYEYKKINLLKDASIKSYTGTDIIILNDGH